MKKLYSILLILLFTFSVAGCGFHLRGHEPIPPQLRILYLQTDKPFSPFSKQLQNIFRRSGVLLTNCTQSAPVTLRIVADNFTQSTTSIGSSGQVTTYLLNYTVIFQLMDAQGRVILCPQTVSTSRTYSITSNQLLSNINSLDDLQDDMRRDLIYQLMDRLRSPMAWQALNRVN